MYSLSHSQLSVDLPPPPLLSSPSVKCGYVHVYYYIIVPLHHYIIVITCHCCTIVQSHWHIIVQSYYYIIVRWHWHIIVRSLSGRTVISLSGWPYAVSLTDILSVIFMLLLLFTEMARVEKRSKVIPAAGQGNLC